MFDLLQHATIWWYQISVEELKCYRFIAYSFWWLNTEENDFFRSFDRNRRNCNSFDRNSDETINLSKLWSNISNFGTKCFLDFLRKFHDITELVITVPVMNPINFHMKYTPITSQHFQQKTRWRHDLRPSFVSLNYYFLSTLM